MQPFSRFLRLAKITLVFVYLVIIAGSVVRATGSGMGCPDWPKCFGHWIPPTDASQLPANYRDYFRVQEQRIAPFNALQTWTEYGNRLIGAILGLLMFAQVFFAFRLRKTNPGYLRLAVLSLVLTGMEGVLGAIVVFTNLKTGVITLHMFLSLIILIMQSYLVFRASGTKSTKPVNPFLRNLIIISLVLTTLQILLGTQVRESVDHLVRNFDESRRGDILDNAGISFLIHSFTALLVLLLNTVVIYNVWKDKTFFQSVKKSVLGIGGIILLEILAGASLKWFALPPLIQPVHLLLATLLFGLQWGFVMRTEKAG